MDREAILLEQKAIKASIKSDKAKLRQLNNIMTEASWEKIGLDDKSISLMTLEEKINSHNAVQLIKGPSEYIQNPEILAKQSSFYEEITNDKKSLRNVCIEKREKIIKSLNFSNIYQISSSEKNIVFYRKNSPSIEKLLNSKKLYKDMISIFSLDQSKINNLTPVLRLCIFEVNNNETGPYHYIFKVFYNQKSKHLTIHSELLDNMTTLNTELDSDDFINNVSAIIADIFQQTVKRRMENLARQPQ